MNSTLAVLRRWLEMDKQLVGGCLCVPRFAAEYKVSTRTVRRDLEAFRRLGQRMEQTVLDVEGSWEFSWRYKDGAPALFACNVRRRTRRD